MQGSKLKEKEKLCKQYYNEIVKYLNKLESDYKNGRISYEEHFKKEGRFLKGRSEKWWYDHLRQCVVKLRNGEDCHIESPRRESKLPINLIVIFIAIFGIILVSQYTGFVTFGTGFTSKGVNLTFVNSTMHDLSLDHDPVSLKVSGSYSGKGSFRLYLEDNGNRLIIADSSVASNNLVTGNIVANITENVTATTQETTIEETTTIEATSTVLENATTTIIQNTTTSVLENTTTTSIMENATTTVLENTTSTVLVDVTSTILVNVSTSTSTSIQPSITFQDSCIETCILTGISQNIKIIAIIDDGSLTISKISYSYVTETQQVLESGNVTVNESIKQLPAEIDKPVIWAKEVYIKNEENTTITKSITVDIPDVADNIKIDGQSITSLSSGNVTYTIDTNLQPAEEIVRNITYETPPPTVNEEEIDNGKRIVISSDLHYEDILAYTSVDENVEGTWNVYWIRDGQRTGLATTRIDTNDNGRIDRVEWTIPGLSNQTFEVLAESSTTAFYSNLLSMQPSIWIKAENSSDSFGNAARLADINGDGYSDMIIGALGASIASRSAAGAVYVFYGKKYNTSITFNLDIQRANLTIYGPNSTANLGTQLATGDINADGKADIFATADGTGASPPGGSGAGEAYIIYGANYTYSSIIDLDILKANITIYGDDANDGLGVWSNALGDVNGDGKADILLGCNACEPPSKTNTGMVYLWYGRAYVHGTKFDLNAQKKGNVTWAGTTTTNNDNYGNSVTLGDITGDGKKDIIIGVRKRTFVGSASGQVDIWYGANYTNGKEFNVTTNFANFSIYGEVSNGNIGESVFAKDINGDRKDDVFITAPGRSPVSSLEGNVFILYGKNYVSGSSIDIDAAGSPENINVTIGGKSTNDQIGYAGGGSASVATNKIVLDSGDFNGDGRNDTVFGGQLVDSNSLTDSGAAYILYGANYSNGKRILMGTTPSNFTVHGANASLSLGASVALGDINKDGVADLLIGSPSGTSQSYAYVIWGGERAPRLDTTPMVNDTSPIVNTVLNCTTGLYTDPDSDPLYKNFFKWYRNNVQLQFNTTSKLDLNSQAEEVGDNIICSQKVSDGYFNSSWKNSTTIKIATSPGVSIINVPSGGNTVSFPKRTVEILTPDPLTLDLKDTVTIPIKIKNNIDTPLRGIVLYAKSDTPDLTFTFTQDSIQVLNPGQEITINMIIESHSTPGGYSIDIGINVTQPRYSDITKLYITLVDRGIFNKTIIVTRVAFAKDLFKENPECLELDELLVRAQDELDLNNFDKARELTEEAVRGCKDLVTSEIPTIQRPVNNTNLIFIISLMGLIISTIIVYVIIKKKPSNS